MIVFVAIVSGKRSGFIHLGLTAKATSTANSANSGVTRIALLASPVDEEIWSARREGNDIPTVPLGCDIDGRLILMSPQGQQITVPHEVADLLDTCRVSDHDEWITGVASNPLDPGRSLILLTERYPSRPGGVIGSRVYSYNLKTASLQLLYVTVVKDRDGAGEYLVPIGTQSSSLLMRTHVSGTDNVCSKAFYDPTGIDQFYSLDLARLSVGLKNYEVPNTLANRDAAREAACEASYNP